MWGRRRGLRKRDGRLDWKAIVCLDLDEIEEKTLDKMVPMITNCRPEWEFGPDELASGYQKAFELTQLIIEYLSETKKTALDQASASEAKYKRLTQSTNGQADEIKTLEEQLVEAREVIKRQKELITARETELRGPDHYEIFTPCLICNKGFQRPLYLREHMARRHPGRTYRPVSDPYKHPFYNQVLCDTQTQGIPPLPNSVATQTEDSPAEPEIATETVSLTVEQYLRERAERSRVAIHQSQETRPSSYDEIDRMIQTTTDEFDRRLQSLARTIERSGTQLLRGTIPVEVQESPMPVPTSSLGEINQKEAKTPVPAVTNIHANLARETSQLEEQLKKQTAEMESIRKSIESGSASREGIAWLENKIQIREQIWQAQFEMFTAESQEKLDKVREDLLSLTRPRKNALVGPDIGYAEMKDVGIEAIITVREQVVQVRHLEVPAPTVEPIPKPPALLPAPRSVEPSLADGEIKGDEQPKAQSSDSEVLEVLYMREEVQENPEAQDNVPQSKAKASRSQVMSDLNQQLSRLGINPVATELGTRETKRALRRRRRQMMEEIEQNQKRVSFEVEREKVAKSALNAAKIKVLQDRIASSSRQLAATAPESMPERMSMTTDTSQSMPTPTGSPQSVQDETPKTPIITKSPLIKMMDAVRKCCTNKCCKSKYCQSRCCKTPKDEPDSGSDIPVQPNTNAPQHFQSPRQYHLGPSPLKPLQSRHQYQSGTSTFKPSVQVLYKRPASTLKPVSSASQQAASPLIPETPYNAAPSALNPAASPYPYNHSLSSLKPDQHAASALRPVLSCNQQEASALRPVSSRNQQESGALRPVSSRKKQASSRLKPVSIHYEEVASAVRPVSSHNEEVASAVRPVSIHYEEVASAVRTVSSRNQQESGAVRPVSSRKKQASSRLKPVSIHYEEVASAVRPVSSHYEEVASAVRPVSIHYEEVASAVRHVSSHCEEVASAVRPVSSHYEEVASAVRPVSFHYEEVASAVRPVFSHYEEVESAVRPVSIHYEEVASAVRPVSRSYSAASTTSKPFSSLCQKAAKTVKPIQLHQPMSQPNQLAPSTTWPSVSRPNLNPCQPIRCPNEPSHYPPQPFTRPPHLRASLYQPIADHSSAYQYQPLAGPYQPNRIPYQPIQRPLQPRHLLKPVQSVPQHTGTGLSHQSSPSKVKSSKLFSRFGLRKKKPKNDYTENQVPGTKESLTTDEVMDQRLRMLAMRAGSPAGFPSGQGPINFPLPIPWMSPVMQKQAEEALKQCTVPAVPSSSQLPGGSSQSKVERRPVRRNLSAEFEASVDPRDNHRVQSLSSTSMKEQDVEIKSTPRRVLIYNKDRYRRKPSDVGRVRTPSPPPHSDQPDLFSSAPVRDPIPTGPIFSRIPVRSPKQATGSAQRAALKSISWFDTDSEGTPKGGAKKEGLGLQPSTPSPSKGKQQRKPLYSPIHEVPTIAYRSPKQKKMDALERPGPGPWAVPTSKNRPASNTKNTKHVPREGYPSSPRPWPTSNAKKESWFSPGN